MKSRVPTPKSEDARKIILYRRSQQDKTRHQPCDQNRNMKPLKIPAKQKLRSSGFKATIAEAGNIAGCIFTCDNVTTKMFLESNVFGVELARKHLLAHVTSGMMLFLFDNEARQLFGIFEASEVDLGNYGAQVRFRILRECLPLEESEFREATFENHMDLDTLRLDLTSSQVSRLIQIFSQKLLRHESFEVERCRYSRRGVVLGNREREHMSSFSDGVSEQWRGGAAPSNPSEYIGYQAGPVDDRQYMHGSNTGGVVGYKYSNYEERENSQDNTVTYKNETENYVSDDWLAGEDVYGYADTLENRCVETPHPVSRIEPSTTVTYDHRTPARPISTIDGSSNVNLGRQYWKGDQRAPLQNGVKSAAYTHGSQVPRPYGYSPCSLRSDHGSTNNVRRVADLEMAGMVNPIGYPHHGPARFSQGSGAQTDNDVAANFCKNMGPVCCGGVNNCVNKNGKTVVRCDCIEMIFENKLTHCACARHAPPSASTSRVSLNAEAVNCRRQSGEKLRRVTSEEPVPETCPKPPVFLRLQDREDTDTARKNRAFQTELQIKQRVELGRKRTPSNSVKKTSQRSPAHERKSVFNRIGGAAQTRLQRVSGRKRNTSISVGGKNQILLLSPAHERNDSGEDPSHFVDSISVGGKNQILFQSPYHEQNDSGEEFVDFKRRSARNNLFEVGDNPQRAQTKKRRIVRPDLGLKASELEQC